MCLVNKNMFTIKCDDVCSICRGGAHGMMYLWARISFLLAQDVEIGICSVLNWYLQQESRESQWLPINNILSHSTDDLSIMVIEKLESKIPNLRKKKESYSSHHLQSLSPAGDEPGPVDMSSLCTPPPCTLQTSSHLTMNTPLFARHVDVLCLATYKNVPVCHNFVHLKETTLDGLNVVHLQQVQTITPFYVLLN